MLFALITRITTRVANVPKTVNYPAAFLFKFVIRLHLHKTKNSIDGTIVAIIYLFNPGMDAILASSSNVIPHRNIEKDLEKAASVLK